jgi:hypothetical protein
MTTLMHLGAAGSAMPIPAKHINVFRHKRVALPTGIAQCPLVSPVVNVVVLGLGKWPQSE